MKKRKNTNNNYPFDNFPAKFLIYEDTEGNEIFHEKTFIGTGLGGESHRLKNYAVISTKTNQPFTKEQKRIIRDVFTKVCQEHDSKMEELTSCKTYALIKLLVSIEVAIGKILDQGLIDCNKKEDFLRFHYFVTNIKKPSKKEIKEYLE